MSNSLDEFIDKFLKPGFEAVQAMPYWLQLVLVLAVIIVTQGPKLLALRARWFDYRLNRNRLQFEKERLETLKLHYEIEAIKKNNSLSTDAYETDLLKEQQKTSINITNLHLPTHFPKLLLKLDAHIKQKQLWGWVTKYPRFGKFLVGALYLFIALNAYVTAFVAISMIVISLSVESFTTELGGVGPVLAMDMIYVLITLVFFYWKRVFAHFQTLLDINQADSGSA